MAIIFLYYYSEILDLDWITDIDAILLKIVINLINIMDMIIILVLKTKVVMTLYGAND